MRLLRHPLFITASVLTICNGMMGRMGCSLPYISSYLDDLACFPVILTIALALLRVLTRQHDYLLSRGRIIFAIIYFSVVFEGVLPAASNSYTSDPFDIVAYAAGALLFERYINKTAGREHGVRGEASDLIR
jgi:hypothetical protein